MNNVEKMLNLDGEKQQLRVEKVPEKVKLLKATISNNTHDFPYVYMSSHGNRKFNTLITSVHTQVLKCQRLGKSEGLPFESVLSNDVTFRMLTTDLAFDLHKKNSVCKFQ